MSGAWKKTMLYLGLGPDEEYDEQFQSSEFDDEPAVRAPSAAPEVVPERPRNVPRAVRTTTTAQRSEAARPAGAASAGGGTGVRVIPGDKPVVRAVPAPQQANPSIVSPETFNDAQVVGDAFKLGRPVIVNLQGADKELARRLIDFASGLCYACEGKMEKVANSVYLLSPEDVELTEEDRRRFSEGDLSD
ncbi:MAG: cell division protein SepF [Acidobacteria bacterium]|nr:cell division protein SepF [Acidobacteriota bacterium]